MFFSPMHCVGGRMNGWMNGWMDARVAAKAQEEGNNKSSSKRENETHAGNGGEKGTGRGHWLPDAHPVNPRPLYWRGQHVSFHS